MVVSTASVPAWCNDHLIVDREAATNVAEAHGRSHASQLGEQERRLTHRLLDDADVANLQLKLAGECLYGLIVFNHFLMHAPYLMLM